MSQPAKDYSRGCPRLHPIREKSYYYALRKLYGVPDKYLSLYTDHGKYTPQKACEDLEAYRAGRPLPHASKITKYHKMIKKDTWHRGLLGTLGAKNARTYVFKKVYGMSDREIADTMKAMKTSGIEHYTMDMAAKELRFQNKKRRNPTSDRYKDRDFKYAPGRRIDFRNLKYAHIDPKDKYKQGRQGFSYGASSYGNTFSPATLPSRRPGSTGPRYSPRAHKGYISGTPIPAWSSTATIPITPEQRQRAAQMAQIQRQASPPTPTYASKEERRQAKLARRAAAAGRSPPAQQTPQGLGRAGQIVQRFEQGVEGWKMPSLFA